jgi:hypothetical protein
MVTKKQASPEEGKDIKFTDSAALLYGNLKYGFNYFRTLLIVVDMTETMNLNDIKPTRFKFLVSKLERFIVNYFKYNFVSTITLLSMKNYTTQVIYPNSYEPAILLQFLTNEHEPEGVPSLFNALNVSLDALILR